MNKKLFKKSVFVLFLLMLLGITATTYAFWDKLTNRQNDNTVTIGEGTTIVVNAVATPEEGKTLIPSGMVLGVNDVEEVVITYYVKLSKEAQNALNLNVTAENITVGGIENPFNLVNVAIVQDNALVNNVDVLVTITVTINTPVNESEYNSIANKQIKFDLVFKAE